jgi:uncharacterized protein (DUF1499 family)
MNKKTATAAELKELHGLVPGTLANMRHKQIGPKYIKMPGGRKILYFVDDVEKWLQGQGKSVLTKDFDLTE